MTKRPKPARAKARKPAKAARADFSPAVKFAIATSGTQTRVPLVRVLRFLHRWNGRAPQALPHRWRVFVRRSFSKSPEEELHDQTDFDHCRARGRSRNACLRAGHQADG